MRFGDSASGSASGAWNTSAFMTPRSSGHFERSHSLNTNAPWSASSSELESVDGRTPFEMPFPLSPAEEEFIEVLDPYLAALVQAVRALATICARLAKEAAGTRTGSYKTFKEDVRQYEIVAGGYAKLGDRLSVLARSLPP
jgi:hypothetical protein